MTRIHSVNFREDLRPGTPEVVGPSKEVAAAQQVFLNAAEGGSAAQEKDPVKTTFWKKFKEKASRVAQHRTALLASLAALVLLGIVAAIYSGRGNVPPAQSQESQPTPPPSAASSSDSAETPATPKAPAAEAAPVNANSNPAATSPESSSPDKILVQLPDPAPRNNTQYEECSISSPQPLTPALSVNPYFQNSTSTNDTSSNPQPQNLSKPLNFSQFSDTSAPRYDKPATTPQSTHFKPPSESSERSVFLWILSWLIKPTITRY